MLEWITANLATIVVAAIVVAVVAFVIVKMVKDRKKGRGTCSCGCGGCPQAGTCRTQPKTGKNS